MAFKERSAVEERIAMFLDFEPGAFTAGDLADRYGVSRETFYVWKRRREIGDEHWFEALSRAPVSCPHATPETPIAAIAAMRVGEPGPRFAGKTG